MTEEREVEVPDVCKRCSYSMNIQLFGYCPMDDEDHQCEKLHPKEAKE